MQRTIRRRKMTSTERIADALEGIARDLYQLVQYAKAHEDRQKIYSNVMAGFVPMLQKYVADTLGPKHPTMPFIPAMFRKHHKRSSTKRNK